MLRAVLILLTTGGILVCPLVCALNGPACCGGSGCSEYTLPACTDTGSQDRAPDPCQAHGCVCKGAVEPRHDPGLDPGLSIAGPCLLLAVVPEGDLPGRAASSCCREDAAPAYLESGRTIRLVLGSLLL